MLKRLSILIMTLLLVVPALAQPQEGCECVFGPKAGQWQFNFNVGTGQFFNDFTGLYYMLPEEDGRAIGLGIDTDEDVIGTKYGLGNAYISGDLSTILANTGSLNYTLKNFSVGAKYFITDHININLSGAYIMTFSRVRTSSKESRSPWIKTRSTWIRALRRPTWASKTSTRARRSSAL